LCFEKIGERGQKYVFFIPELADFDHLEKNLLLQAPDPTLARIL
jgi:hypothetical protein